MKLDFDDQVRAASRCWRRRVMLRKVALTTAKAVLGVIGGLGLIGAIIGIGILLMRM